MQLNCLANNAGKALYLMRFVCMPVLVGPFTCLDCLLVLAHFD